MKKIFLCALTFCFFSSLSPIIYTNKTFMALPTPHYYVPLKYSSWHRIIKQGSSAKNPWATTLQVIPFYRTSYNEINLGKYFGTNFKNELTIGRTSPETDIKTDLIIHKWDSENPSLVEGKLILKPKHTVYGGYFSYHQELNNIHNGLFFQINIPLVHVENELSPTGTNCGGCKQNPTGVIFDYFNGTYKQDDPENKQYPLTRAKITNLQGQTGIADLEIIFGSKFVEKEEHEVKGSLKLIVPTGNKPNGCYLFPAVVGNGRHWGLGAMLNGSMNINKSETSSLECLFDVEFTYLFDADEKRTLGFRKGFGTEPSDNRQDTTSTLPWNYYILGGEAGKQGVFPLANVLTQDVSVSPGSKLQGHASFAYHRSNVTFDFGYSFFAQEGEKIDIKCWEDNKYAPANTKYVTTNNFSVADYESVEPPALGDSIGGPIQKSMLDVYSPATPGVLKHSIHGAIGYTLSEWENPIVMGCGFSVDWTQDNSTAVGYTLWAKFGVTF